MCLFSIEYTSGPCPSVSEIETLYLVFHSSLPLAAPGGLLLSICVTMYLPSHPHSQSLCNPAIDV